MLGENVRSSTAGPTIKSTGYPRAGRRSRWPESRCVVLAATRQPKDPHRIPHWPRPDKLGLISSLAQPGSSSGGGGFSFVPSIPELLDVVAAVSIILDEKRPGEGAWKVKPS